MEPNLSPLTAYIPPPDTLGGFPTARRAKPKGGRRRWKDDDGQILEWDYQHGRVEVYTGQGEHLGEFHPETAERTKEADPSRRIEP